MTANIFNFEQVKVTREKVTWPGAKIRKSGEGMPNYENNNVKGSLYITFDVQFPKVEFTDEEKKRKCTSLIILFIYMYVYEIVVFICMSCYM